MVLGYEQGSWDHKSGPVRKPWSAKKSWRALTDSEKTAAGLLGYFENSWDNLSGSEPQPASAKKKWTELTVCTDGEGILAVQCLLVLISLELNPVLSPLYFAMSRCALNFGSIQF